MFDTKNRPNRNVIIDKAVKGLSVVTQLFRRLEW